MLNKEGKDGREVGNNLKEIIILPSKGLKV
jgi:hypothetical protein